MCDPGSSLGLGDKYEVDYRSKRRTATRVVIRVVEEHVRREAVGRDERKPIGLSLPIGDELALIRIQKLRAHSKRFTLSCHPFGFSARGASRSFLLGKNKKWAKKSLTY